MGLQHSGIARATASAAYLSRRSWRRPPASPVASSPTTRPESTQPPGALLVDLARALKVTTDELLGVVPTTEKTPPKIARLLKKLQKVAELPPADQRTVLTLLDALHESRQRTTRRG